MSFSTIAFLFVFFPVALLLYYVLPKKIRPLIMVLLSLVFYAWGDVRHMAVLLFSILFNYFSGLEIGELKAREQYGAARFAVIVTAAADILVLCVYKYLAGALPLGLSFYTFSVLSYVFDVYRDRAEGERNILKLALYVSFFPKLVSGPIVQYHAFREQLDGLAPGRDGLTEGAELFLTGLFKKVLLADNLGRVFAALSGMSAVSVGSAWLAAIFYSLQLYFDFSGYSDMAIGLGRMFGFRMERNFNYPYISRSVSEFWRRWHISLGAWFRDYVYIPLGGSRSGPGRQFRNLLVVWVLTGLWHGSTLNFLFWGLYHGAFVMLEKFVVRDRLDRVPGGIRAVVTDLIVFIGWVFFSAASLRGGFQAVGQMFGAGSAGFWDAAASYYLFNNLLLLIAAFLFATPLPRVIHENLIVKFPRGVMVLSAAVYGLLLAFSIAGMVNATYSTFLYFQF